MPKLRHYDHLGSIRFVTFSCYHFHPYLSTPQSRDIFITHLQLLREQTRTLILGYVLMPDHVHLVVSPSIDSKLGVIIGKLKRASTYDLRTCWQLSHGIPVWQQRGFDHNCRSIEAAVTIINYCHQNPVRRGLVAVDVDWKWSSARWYDGSDRDGLQIDELF